MADHPSLINPSKKVQNNIQIFESLSLGNNGNPSKLATRSVPVVEIVEDVVPPPLLTAVSSKSTVRNTDTPPTSLRRPVNAARRNRDSAIYIPSSYLKSDFHAKDPPQVSVEPTPGSTNDVLISDAIEILKSKPEFDDIVAVLKYIQYGMNGKHDFNIKLASPKATQLVHVLVTVTLPDVWPILASEKCQGTEVQARHSLLTALSSVTGIKAIIESIQRTTKSGALTETVTTSEASVGNAASASTHSFGNKIYVDFLATMLAPHDTIFNFIVKDSKELYGPFPQFRKFWPDMVALLAGGKVFSTIAPVLMFDYESAYWISDPKTYTAWLAQNIIKASIDIPVTDGTAWRSLSLLLGTALSFGHNGTLVPEIYMSLLLGATAMWTSLHLLLKGLQPRQQKTFFGCMLDDLNRTYFNPNAVKETGPNMTTAKAISAVAALLHGLLSHSDYLMECAIEWVHAPRDITEGSGYRQALFILLAESEGKLMRIVERGLTDFSDKVQISHASTTQQEHLAQTILLVIGYLYRLNIDLLKRDPIPTLVMRAVSNRLSSSVPRIRLLGMIVGVGMSKCVDEPGKVMDFKVEEMETVEVRQLLSLIDVNDTIGSLDDLKEIRKSQQPKTSAKKRKMTATRSPPSPLPPISPRLSSKILAIEEVSSSEDDEEDLVPYRKPIYDPEDSDEDPTLIDRDKPRAPIYIIDLIKQLQLSSDKLDVISLALETAPSLIRRKSEFGTELSDNVYGLVSALINLQDGMSKSEHQQQRLDSLVACVVARPHTMGKHLASTYFNGDFSLSQRSTILIAIGLGAREVAGFTDVRKDSELAGIDTFPSQRLPSRLQPNPLTSPSPCEPEKELNLIAALTNTATNSIIRPLALAAAESQAGPKILQINRTSSSLSTKSKQQNHRPASHRLPKDIKKTLANDMYLPLISPLTTVVSYTTTTRPSATLLLHPSILSLHLQTLTLLLHTLGPTGLSPPAIYTSLTHETLLLLSTLTRSPLSFDGLILPTLLSLFLALIDITVEIGVTAQERLVGDDFGRMVSELVRWTAGLEGNGAPPPVKADAVVPWTVLAAGIQVRWVEIGRRFQARMMGLSEDDL